MRSRISASISNFAMFHRGTEEAAAEPALFANLASLARGRQTFHVDILAELGPASLKAKKCRKNS
jgi:hypothetical protein